jgi:quinol monooxygenase YgiN
MVIVMARVKVRTEQFSEAWALSKLHVARSRQEPGCISHNVYRDDEHENHLVFTEEWESERALAAHFSVPASAAFVNALAAMSVGKTAFHIYTATELPFPQLGAA